MAESRTSNGNIQGLHRLPSHTKSPIGQLNNTFDMNSLMSGISNTSDQTSPTDTDASSAIRIRKIAPHTTHGKLQDVLEFIVKDFERVDLVASAMVDQGFQTAIARFASPSAAQEAQATLDGRQLNPNRPNDPRIIVEIMRLSPGSIGSGRNNFDFAATRAHSGSSTGSTSRMNGAYQSMSRISPPNGVNGYGSAGSHSDRPEMVSSGSNYLPSSSDHRQRVSGRDVISEDGPDDETSDLLRDPLGYATNGMNGLSRRSTGNSQSTSHYNKDELKAMFSKQRGYKRLCFRTKQNGPMCFVEFEDISFATKALNDLYGYPLHNSAHRGGIRLSFSKNPLGVRNGQPGGMGPPTPLSPSGQFPSMNGLGIQPFTTANGPPPGIPAPPGLPLTSNGGANGMMSPTSLGFGGMTNGGSNGIMSPTSMGFSMNDLNAAMGAVNPISPYGMVGGWPRQEGYGGYADGR
ncbi:MAG: hypothetical protein Q9164_004747 [Protoblastenia rupestris]